MGPASFWGAGLFHFSGEGGGFGEAVVEAAIVTVEVANRCWGTDENGNIRPRVKIGVVQASFSFLALSPLLHPVNCAPAFIRVPE